MEPNQTKQQFLLDNLGKITLIGAESSQLMANAQSQRQYSLNERGAVSVDGVYVDHINPESGAKTWVEKNRDSLKSRRAFILGFGGGYHIEVALSQFTGDELYVVEPDRHLLRFAMSQRSMTLDPRVRIVVGDLSPIVDLDLSDAKFLIRSQYLASEAHEQIKSLLRKHRTLNYRPRVMIVGPIDGGTLPIIPYCYDALQKLGPLNRNPRVLDIGQFGDGFRYLDTLSEDNYRKGIMRSKVAIALSTLLTDLYEERAFDICLFLAQAPINPVILDELRKKGVQTALWFTEDYLRFTSWQEQAKNFDFVFCIQKKAIEPIRNAKAKYVSYLPMAASPAFHRADLAITPEDQERFGSDVSFVGAGYYNRVQVFLSIAYLRSFKIWGSEWPIHRDPFNNLVQEESRRVSTLESVKIFNSSQINLNLHSSREVDGIDNGDFVNPRFFELALCRAFQLVDPRVHLAEIVGPEDVATFSSVGDLKEKISYFLAQPAARQRYIDRCYEIVSRHHTYEKRLEQMLHIILESGRIKGDAVWEQVFRRLKDNDKIEDEFRERITKSYENGYDPKLAYLTDDIYLGKGNLSNVEQKLLFLYHVNRQVSRRAEIT